MATTTRFDHTNCKHARTGAEGKKARAACRKAHAEKATKASKVSTPRAKATPKTVSTRTPRKTPVKAQVLDMSKADADLEVPAL